MSKLRESVLSNCERKFVLKCLNDFKRLDGRAFDEFRELKIEFGKDWGSCLVSLGETQVLAQVSCEVKVPKSTRPSEGVLFLNLELNPLAAPHFEAGRQSDLSVQLNRLLEKCIKDSKAVDLESLCIKVNEKVWALRVDLNVLNHEGNILDCASIATLAALAHFRRPDVTCDGEEVIIHTYAQRDSIPTVIHHYPICISFAIFSNGEIILSDPTLLEESVSETHLMVGLNAYKELCGFHLGGNAFMAPNLILSTTNRAAKRAIAVIQQIKDAVDSDEKNRLENKDIGFEFSSHLEKNVSRAKENLSQCLDRWIMKKGKKKAKATKMEVDEIKPASVETIGKQTAVLLPPETNANVWDASNSEEESEEEELAPQIVDKQDMPKDVNIISDGSEEESTVVLNADKQTNKKKRKGKSN